MSSGEVRVTAKRRNKSRWGKDKKSGISPRVASMIVAKKRRRSGERAKCQGMCFSGPAPDDPFNDWHGKKKKGKMRMKIAVDNGSSFIEKVPPPCANAKTPCQSNLKMAHLEEKCGKVANLTACENGDYPSKFLCMCLNTIERVFLQESSHDREHEHHLFFNPWGFEFFKCCLISKNILETSGSSLNFEQIAWVASMAADAIAKKEKEGLEIASPFLLFLVPSKEVSIKVRSLCKPLKVHGIHTVSLHDGATLDHQIHGLKSCEPEFVASTPGRLLELVSLNAIGLSQVSFLVIDGVESLYKDGFQDALTSIRNAICGKPRIIVFNDSFGYTCLPVLQNLFLGPICRLSLNNSISSKSACITQKVFVCNSEDDQVVKSIRVLRHEKRRNPSSTLKMLYVARKGESHNIIKTLKCKGYTISTSSNSDTEDTNKSCDSEERGKRKAMVSVIEEESISKAKMGIYEVVVLPNFVACVDSYRQVIVGMARSSVSGAVYSYLAQQDAPLAKPLVAIMEQCGQAVPKPLRNLRLPSSSSSASASSMSESE